MNTRKLVVEEGGFLYDSDAYSDDLPYWTREYGDKPHLIIPYTLSENDMRFAIANGEKLYCTTIQNCSDAINMYPDHYNRFLEC